MHRKRADDALVEHCARLGVCVYRGSAANVAERVLLCAEKHGWQQFARINADSPFLDAGLIDEGIRGLLADELDVVTNVQPRTYPHGIAVEVFSTAAFRRSYRNMQDADEHEHISRHFYRHADRFRIGVIPPAARDYTDVRLTVDTPADLKRAAVLIERLGPNAETATWREIVAAYRRCWPPAGLCAAGQSRT